MTLNLDSLNISSQEVCKILRAIGFKVYYNVILGRNVIAVPENEVSELVRKFLMTYYYTFENFKLSEKVRARKDYKKAIEMLELGNYTVENINCVIIQFETKGSTPYEKEVEGLMRSNGFSVTFKNNVWYISVIRKEGD